MFIESLELESKENMEKCLGDAKLLSSLRKVHMMLTVEKMEKIRQWNMSKFFRK